MYTASVNDMDPDERSEYDIKNESVVEKWRDMAWKISWECRYLRLYVIWLYRQLYVRYSVRYNTTLLSEEKCRSVFWSFYKIQSC